MRRALRLAACLALLSPLALVRCSPPRSEPLAAPVFAPVSPASPGAAAPPLAESAPVAPVVPAPHASANAQSPKETGAGQVLDPIPPTARVVSIDEDDVREAVFRYQFGHSAAANRAPRVLCLEISGGDPSPAFLKRFAAEHALVRPVSACTASAQGVVDNLTGKEGLLFRVGGIQWDHGRASVEGGYFEAGLSASGNTYVVERKGHAFKVVKDVMHWIS